jgi:aspartate kinase
VGSVERVKRVAERVARHAKEGQRIAVVVSAMAGETNRLVELMMQTNPNASPKNYDMAIAAGEQVSVGLVAAAIESFGVKAEPVLGHQLGILTDERHSQARIQKIKTDLIEACWNQGSVPVVAGFQGITPSGALTTLGRGGSDTSAVALAVALKADLCEINTDVDAIYTTDPRIVPEAKPILELDYDTALELAALGGKVLHSRCVELGAKYRMPIVVRSSFDPDDARSTKIMNFSESEALESPAVSAISLDQDVTRVSVSGIEKNPLAMSRLFAAVAQNGVNVDIIVHNSPLHSPTFNVGFTVTKADLSSAMLALEMLKKEPDFEGIAISTHSDLAKVSAVGLGMKSHSGVAAKVFETLSLEKIEVLMVSTSEIKISCVVSLAEGKRAVQALHSAFF